MVFQSYALFPHWSGAENIVFGLKVRRVDLTQKHKIHPRGVESGTTPKGFEKKAAMIWTTTGHLTSIRNNAQLRRLSPRRDEVVLSVPQP